MRFLLVNNHCISDPTAGVTQSLRTIVEWLADAGHRCHVLTTARFEARVSFTIEEHLTVRGVAVPRTGKKSGRARPVVHYQVRDVPITLFLTRHNDETRPNREEGEQWEEPFGRVAAEAMINAIPPLVSNRGSRPHVVGGDFNEGGGGRVLTTPDWMTVKTTTLPSEQEVEP